MSSSSINFIAFLVVEWRDSTFTLKSFTLASTFLTYFSRLSSFVSSASNFCNTMSSLGKIPSAISNTECTSSWSLFSSGGSNLDFLSRDDLFSSSLDVELLFLLFLLSFGYKSAIKSLKTLHKKLFSWSSQQRVYSRAMPDPVRVC